MRRPGRFRAREEDGAHIPIIALTADAVTDARTKSLAAGMNDYVTKPIHADELAAVLERWTSPRQQPLAELEAAAERRAPGSQGPQEPP